MIKFPVSSQGIKTPKKLNRIEVGDPRDFFDLLSAVEADPNISPRMQELILEMSLRGNDSVEKAVRKGLWLPDTLTIGESEHALTPKSVSVVTSLGEGAVEIEGANLSRGYAALHVGDSGLSADPEGLVMISGRTIII